MREPQTSHLENSPPSIGAVILAAGQSQRMCGVDKTFAPLLGKPLILHTLEPFQSCATISRIVLVLSESNIEQARALIREETSAHNVFLCPGGLRRQDSARCGLAALGKCEWVVVHDGARPCLDQERLERGISHALKHGNAVAAVPVTDTIKAADSQGYVTHTLPRGDLWAVQTPQIFPFAQLREAYERGQGDVTDDAALIERLGNKVKLYPGSYDNIKVTTPQDLALAEMILAKRRKSG